MLGRRRPAKQPRCAAGLGQKNRSDLEKIGVLAYTYGLRLGISGSRVSGMDFQLCSTGLFFRSSGMYAEFSLGFRLEALDHNACATSVAIARFRICL